MPVAHVHVQSCIKRILVRVWNFNPLQKDSTGTVWFLKKDLQHSVSASSQCETVVEPGILQQAVENSIFIFWTVYTFKFIIQTYFGNNLEGKNWWTFSTDESLSACLPFLNSHTKIKRTPELTVEPVSSLTQRWELKWKSLWTNTNAVYKPQTSSCDTSVPHSTPTSSAYWCKRVNGMRWHITVISSQGTLRSHAQPPFKTTSRICTWCGKQRLGRMWNVLVTFKQYTLSSVNTVWFLLLFCTLCLQ